MTIKYHFNNMERGGGILPTPPQSTPSLLQNDAFYLHFGYRRNSQIGAF